MASRRSPLFKAIAAMGAGCIVLCASGCKRGNKLPMADHIWLSAENGCTALYPEAPNARPKVLCWGSNEYGQLGDGTKELRTVAKPIDLGGTITQLSLGAQHSCAVFDHRVVRCWGSDTKGQLGTNNSKDPDRPTQSLVPLEVPETRTDAGAGTLEVHVGKTHTCIRIGKQTLRCFGEQAELGKIGYYPARYRGDEQIRAFASGESNLCVAWASPNPAQSRVHCAGFGMPDPPEGLLVGLSIKELAVGRSHACALIADGSVRCWGQNDYGQLGDGTITSSPEPVTVTEAKGAVHITSGANHTCVHLANGTVACWGDNRHHQLANGTTTSSGHAAVLVGLVQVKEVACGGDGCCARMDDRSVRCWGLNDHYQLGNGGTVEQSVPMPIRFH